MRRWLVIAAAALLTGAPAGADRVERATPTMTASVEPIGNGRFRAVLHFDEDAPLWIFHRSAVTREGNEDWRQLSWTVRTRGVRLTRIGNHAALVPTAGRMPQTVEIFVRPFAQDLLADYTPAVTFTDGTLAMFSDHFTMRPAPSVEAVAALGASFNSLPDYRGGNPRVVFRSGGTTMRHDGERIARKHFDTPAYVTYGNAAPRISNEISALVDPGLPQWLREQLLAEVPGLLDLYAQKLGPHKGGRPELIAAWEGPTPNLVSFGGSVMDETIILQIEGDRLIAPSRQAFGFVRQFIAHEAAHFWLGSTVGYGDPGDAWTSEGGADLMAQRAAEAIDRQHDASAFIEGSLNNCAAMASDGPLKAAPERHGQQAFYACGLVFSLVAEHHARQSGGDFFSFWRGLIEAERDDGVASVEDWLAALRRAGGTDEQIALISTMHEVGVRDTAASLSALLGSAGYSVTRGEDGRLRLS
ncbi:M1 aminopeptidase family protein [Sphingomicrobium marinum]|uniref:hypothetical protein n=1 Tax=Sphingomicrobium marinum TaxID=1227950 RepID=UPI00223FCD37|nr:hypothetical protein [Sphingomicrobium marinum]